MSILGDRVFLPDTKVHPKSVPVGSDGDVYTYTKVEDFFARFPTETPANNLTVKSVSLDEPNFQIAISLSDNSVALIQVVRYDAIRFRWNTSKTAATDYSQNNPRAIVMDTLSDLRNIIQKTEGYKLSVSGFQNGPNYNLFIGKDGQEFLKVVVEKKFRIEIWRYVLEVPGPDSPSPLDSRYALVWSTCQPSASFSPLQSQVSSEGDNATTLCIDKRGQAMGFGEQGGLSLFKDGDFLTYFDYDNYGYQGVYGQQALDPREPMYHSEPFYVELNGVEGYQSAVATYLDNFSQVYLDVGKAGNWFRWGTRFGDLDIWIITQDDIRGVVKAYTSLVGRQKLVPRYVFGFHQGCYGYDTKEKCLRVVQKYRDYNFPLDGLHIDVDLQRGYRTFTSDPVNFPDLPGMFATIKQQGVKCCTNITPIISRDDSGGYPTLESGSQKEFFVFEQRWNSPNPDTSQYYEGGNEIRTQMQPLTGINSGSFYTGEVSYGPGLGITGYYPEFGRDDVREWWGQQYKYLFDCGLEFVWQDMTTPAVANNRGDMKGFPYRLLMVDDTDSDTAAAGRLLPALKVWNLFSYNLHKATYKGLQALPSRANKRNFVIGRGSYTGMHRWAGLWTGDDVSNWDFLRIQIQQVLSMGICGISITGSDVGGFAPYNNGQWADPQLVTRWQVACTLLPWFRNHYAGKPGSKLFQEPWAYYEKAPDMGDQAGLYRAVLTICRYYVRLRYSLIQVLYDAHYENIATGLPMVRAMVLSDPSDLTLFDVRSEFVASQYVIGDHIFIAPILNEGAQQRDVYLPAGSLYYDFNLHLGGDGNGGGEKDPTPNYLALTAPHPGGQVYTYTSSIPRYVNGDDGHLPYILPMWVREGGIIPIRNVELWIGQHTINPLSVHVYPLSGGREPTTYSVYLDDGVSRDSAPTRFAQFMTAPHMGAKDMYKEWKFVQESSSDGKTRTITLTKPTGLWPLSSITSSIGKTFQLFIWHDPSSAPKTQPGPSINLTPSAGTGVKYDAEENFSVVSLPVDEVAYTVVVGYS